MRIRIYAPFFPFPLVNGTFFVNWFQARALTELGHDVEMISWKGPDPEKNEFPQDIKFKIVDLSKHIRPENRIGRVVESFFSEKPSGATFYYPKLDGPLVELLGEADVGIYSYEFAINWAETGKPAEKCRICHLHNIESELCDLRVKNESMLLRPVHILNREKLNRRLAQLDQHFDELWALSEPDFRVLNSVVCGRKPTRLVPPGFDEAYFQTREKRKQLDDVPRFGFIGKLSFEPNYASCEWILDNVCPELQRLGFKGEILIGGAGASESLIAKGRAFPFVKFLGYIDDPESFWSRLDGSLAPHITGSGTRLKLLESMASGIPVACNTAATLRIDPRLCSWPHLKVSDDANAWAEWMCGFETNSPRRESSLRPPDAIITRTIYSELFPIAKPADANR